MGSPPPGSTGARSPCKPRNPSPPPRTSASSTEPSPAARLRCNPVPLACSYEPHSTQDTTGPWTEHEPVTHSQRIILTGLVRGKDHYFQVRAISSNGPGPWNDIATVMVV